GLQRGSQRRIVIDFPVEDDGDLPIFIEDGLHACRQIDDSQPRRAESKSGLGICAVTVWPPVRQTGHHTLYERGVCPLAAILAANPAHGVSLVVGTEMVN